MIIYSYTIPISPTYRWLYTVILYLYLPPIDDYIQLYHTYISHLSMEYGMIICSYTIPISPTSRWSTGWLYTAIPYLYLPTSRWLYTVIPYLYLPPLDGVRDDYIQLYHTYISHPSMGAWSVVTWHDLTRYHAQGTIYLMSQAIQLSFQTLYMYIHIITKEMMFILHHNWPSGKDRTSPASCIITSCIITSCITTSCIIMSCIITSCIITAIPLCQSLYCVEGICCFHLVTYMYQWKLRFA